MAAGRPSGVQADRHRAAEFEARTPYLYSCYETGWPAVSARNARRASARRKVIILGGGPNRIGQGIEFDYCCVHAAFGLADAGIETIMVNCNPETVSTDYDTSDRLYFEPLTAEDVLEIVRVEASRGELCGVIVQLGGQTRSSSLSRSRMPACRSSAPHRRDRSGRGPAALWSCCAGSACASRRTTSADDQDEALRRAERIGFPW